MIESTVAEEWLYETLAGDAAVMESIGNDAGRIVSYVAPEGTPEPFIVFQPEPQSEPDANTMNGYRIMASWLYIVKAVARGTSVQVVKPVADALDAALHGKSGAVQGGQVLKCVREQGVSYVEYDRGVSYYHLGGLYRIYVLGG